jgi:hypothetical protein
MKVFLSSNAQDLIAHRQVADDTIPRFSQEAVAMERFGALREALDLRSASRLPVGEADAAQVWGEAYFANHEPTLAQRAFTRALEVRRRIEHPGVAETETWLARVG